jgi:hypothetical protein
VAWVCKGPDYKARFHSFGGRVGDGVVCKTWLKCTGSRRQVYLGHEEWCLLGCYAVRLL